MLVIVIGPETAILTATLVSGADDAGGGIVRLTNDEFPPDTCDVLAFRKLIVKDNKDLVIGEDSGCDRGCRSREAEENLSWHHGEGPMISNGAASVAAMLDVFPEI